VATRLSFFNSLTAHCQSYEEMTLCSLPAEIIAQIVSYLPEDDLQSLYSTCNHQIHSICCVPLQRRKVESAATNTRIIFKLLRTSPQDMALRWDSTLASQLFKHHRSEFPPHRHWAPSSSDTAIPLDSTEARVQSYLSFNPGPRWLMPADPHLQTSISDYNILYRQQPFHWNCVSINEMDDFVEDVDALGLTIPGSFYHFMTNSDLQQKYPLGSAYRFCPSLALTRLVSYRLDGYICKFLDNNQ
jgi:hypothetical protein